MAERRLHEICRPGLSINRIVPLSLHSSPLIMSHTSNRSHSSSVNAGPSPASYLLPSLFGCEEHDMRKHKSPSYTIGERIYYVSPSNSPGPKYSVPNYVTRYGADDRKNSSMLLKSSEKKIVQTPGPGAYFPENHSLPNFTTSPAFSICERTKLAKFSHTPSPNAYTLPATYGPTACHTMGIKLTRGSYAADHADAPGPGTYDVTPLDTNKSQAPKYTMLGRSHRSLDRTKKPGPSAYQPSVAVCKPSAPRFSMGRRDSHCFSPLRNL